MNRNEEISELIDAAVDAANSALDLAREAGVSGYAQTDRAVSREQAAVFASISQAYSMAAQNLIARGAAK